MFLIASVKYNVPWVGFFVALSLLILKAKPDNVLERIKCQRSTVTL